MSICQWHTGSLFLWTSGFSPPSHCYAAQYVSVLSLHTVEKAENMFKQHAIRQIDLWSRLVALLSWSPTAARCEAREPAEIWLQLACMNSGLGTRPWSVHCGLVELCQCQPCLGSCLLSLLGSKTLLNSHPFCSSCPQARLQSWASSTQWLSHFHHHSFLTASSFEVARLSLSS